MSYSKEHKSGSEVNNFPGCLKNLNHAPVNLHSEMMKGVSQNRKLVWERCPVLYKRMDLLNLGVIYIYKFSSVSFDR